MNQKKIILFHRDFLGFTGGHLKVYDYFKHVISSKDYQANIYFTPESIWLNNPWANLKKHIQTKWEPEMADVLFLAGMDWFALDELQRQNPPAPVINFIQHVRHADPECPLYQFLKYPAVRICVSQEVSDAILQTGIVNGSVVTSPNGMDLAILPKQVKKHIPLFIDGIKNPVFARELAKQLEKRGLVYQLLLERVSRPVYLSYLNRSKISVLLPHKTEGFYLPALEGMLLKSLVICPDCSGNRSFCIDDETCFQAEYKIDDFIRVIHMAKGLGRKKTEEMLESAYSFTRNFTLEKERETFLQVLENL